MKWGVLVLWISWKWRLHNGTAAGNKKGCLPWWGGPTQGQKSRKVVKIKLFEVCKYASVWRELVGAGRLQVALRDTRAVL